MCGISGIVGLDCRHELIERMVQAQAHRGPDAHGIYVSPDRDCGLGHNRLSIIDLSAAGTQPMTDVSGRYTIVFNGEIYNYRELRRDLSDYPYKTQTDTEVILAAWHKWGEGCLSRFIGMFAFALWDHQEKALIAVRDRLGIKPFHYYFDGHRFIFASEIKSILAAGIEPQADLGIWADYLNLGLYDHSSSSFFKNIKILDPGHILTLQQGRVMSKAFWRLQDFGSSRFQGTEDEAVEQYKALLADSIRLRLRSDVPLGVNLSGGLDSSSLLAMVDRSEGAGNSLKAFTVGFTDSRYDEENCAAQVPVQRQWDRVVARMDCQDIWSAVDDLMYHQEAPYGGIGTLSYYKLFEEIAQHAVTVVLEGQGVDECLGGYKYYQNIGQALTASPHPVYQDGSSFLAPICINPDIRGLGSGFLPPETPFATMLGNALYADMRYRKLPRVLRMNDRLSMAYGKELREPFLDHRLVEFCFSLPDEFKIKAGQGKFLLRKAMAGILPDAVRSPEKRAVVTPQVEWMKGCLKSHVLEIITSESFRSLGLFESDAVINRFRRYCQGEGENGFFIWQWINAFKWSQVFGVKF